MFVAVKIGMPYLWVDRYCIDKNNPEEKHDIIQNMDKTYRGAELTTIATDGDDPNHGLPGVCGTRRDAENQL
jgi:hypothetical protein